MDNVGSHRIMDKVSHLYVHIPFCASRCSYCDFYSSTAASGSASAYVDRLLAEAAACDGNLGLLDTVYLGGGTPTLIGERLLGILLDGLAKRWAPGVEVTAEANPETIDEAMAIRLRNSGVTRVSLGAQSFNKDMRGNLGRSGSMKAVAEAVAYLRAAGLENIGIDMIFGIPGQDACILRNDLEDVLALSPEHISYYELSYNIRGEYHLRWHRELAEVRDKNPHFYQMVVETLEVAGYRRYEISNFAMPGYECRHNISYWEGSDFIGLGAGAWSTTGQTRWHNTENIETYLEERMDLDTVREIEYLSARKKLWEKVMLGLRNASGFPIDEAREVVDEQALEELGDAGLLCVNDGLVTLTSRGFFLADDLCSRILLSE